MDSAFTGNGFTITKVVVGPIDNNAYLVRSQAEGVGFVIDAADDLNALGDLARGTRIDRVITTHGHWDHHQAAARFAAGHGQKPLIHPADAFMVDDGFDHLEPGPFTVGGVDASIVHTPGHTPGSVCVVLEGVVLTGDTLFPGGPGATRFDHSSFDTIIESVRSELFGLPDTTVVLPGHGDATTIGNERGHLQEWIERGW